MTAWLARHASTAIGSLGRLSRQPFASLMIILVIAVTLAIPASLNLADNRNISSASRLCLGDTETDGACEYSCHHLEPDKHA